MGFQGEENQRQWRDLSRLWLLFPLAAGDPEEVLTLRPLWTSAVASLRASAQPPHASANFFFIPFFFIEEKGTEKGTPLNAMAFRPLRRSTGVPPLDPANFPKSLIKTFIKPFLHFRKLQKKRTFVRFFVFINKITMKTREKAVRRSR